MIKLRHSPHLRIAFRTRWGKCCCFMDIAAISIKLLLPKRNQMTAYLLHRAPDAAVTISDAFHLRPCFLPALHGCDARDVQETSSLPRAHRRSVFKHSTVTVWSRAALSPPLQNQSPGCAIVDRLIPYALKNPESWIILC